MELNIILILLSIHVFGVILFKHDKNILSCGIFGWCGKSTRSFDKAKFDILGLYNNSRGGDSCGVSTDGEIYYGITTSKNYGDFLYKSNYEKPKEVPVVIGHTRKSSSGAINSDNAHPFGFGDIDSKFEFVGVHNGTLHNQDELAKTYNLETEVKEINNFNISVFKRKKIDSEILLEILYKEQKFKVLSDYIGGAALMFTDLKEPNVLYVFKGASKIDKGDTGNDVEERPLYYYKEHKNSTYISSIQESLEAIGGIPNQNLFSFRENIVYKITDGNISLSEEFNVSRKLSHQRPAVAARTNYDYCGYNFTKRHETKSFTENNIESKKEESAIRIQDEKEERIFRSPIVFNKLRYSRNGHLVSGIHTWIKDFGFFPLGKNQKESEEAAKKMIGTAFDLEYGYFVQYDDVQDNDEDIIYPFPTSGNVKPAFFYFYEGILLETKLDFEVLEAKARHYTIWDLSEMSRHPVIELELKGSNSNVYKNILHRRNSFTGNVVPLGSSKIYYIEKGLLTKLSKVNKFIDEKTKSSIDKYNKDNEAKQTLLLLEEAKNTDEKLINKKFEQFCELNKLEVVKGNIEYKEDEDYLIENEIIRETIDSVMVPIYLKIQESVSFLADIEEHPFVKNIIDLSEDFLMSLDEVIDKTYK